MEGRFDNDFSRVKVHLGAAAEQSAQEMNAHAYTVGHNMVFDAGRFAPGTQEGRRLIAHELTHVVQQGTFGQIEPMFIGRLSDRLELQADDVSTAIVNSGLSQFGARPALIKAMADPSMPSGVIQRKPTQDTKPVREDKAGLVVLARDPRKAHRAWKKLNKEDRSIVLDSMARLY